MVFGFPVASSTLFLSVFSIRRSSSILIGNGIIFVFQGIGPIDTIKADLTKGEAGNPDGFVASFLYSFNRYGSVELLYSYAKPILLPCILAS